MILIRPSYEIMKIDQDALKLLELAGRTCYKSEDRIGEGTCVPFVRRIVQDYKHESVIEHASMTVKFIVDRGVTHELVRHRLCSFSQESTRYCNYGKKGQVTFVLPPWVDGEFFEVDGWRVLSVWETLLGDPQSLWLLSMARAEREYLDLLKMKWSPQQARSVLPNSLKTEIVTTANFREWRHIFKLRTAQAAHPQMREIMIPLLAEVNQLVPVLFEDLVKSDG